MRSFTLIETLLVVVLLTILSAMVFPSVSSFRGRARAVKSLAQLKQHAGVFAAYATDQRGFFPYVTDPRATWSVLRNPDRDAAVVVAYFGAHSAWNVALAHEYYAGDHLSPVFQSPDEETGFWPRTSYWYSCAMLADPRFWNRRFREGAHQWRATGSHEVVFPAQKALLLDSFAWRIDFALGQQIPCRVALTDGSATSIAPGRLGDSHPSGEAPGLGPIHGTAWPPTHHTTDGVRGRDIR